jgi:hypothetical protein
VGDEFGTELLNIQKAGGVIVSELAIFLNLERGTFYRNRDISLICRRIGNQNKVGFEEFMEYFCL